MVSNLALEELYFGAGNLTVKETKVTKGEKRIPAFTGTTIGKIKCKGRIKKKLSQRISHSR